MFKLNSTQGVWVVYALFYLGITINQNFIEFRYTGSIFTLFTNSIMPIVMLYGIFGYAFQRAFSERRIWRVIFWILFIRFLFIAFINFNAGVVDTPYILALVLSPLPGLYAIFYYSTSNNPIWEDRIAQEDEKFIHELFDNKVKVFAETNEKGAFHKAILSKTTEGFELIIHYDNGKGKTDEKAFSTIEKAADYIENKTPFSIYSFS